MADRVLVVYVPGSKSRGGKNLERGLAAATWGWEFPHDDHQAAQPGDWLLLVFGADGHVRKLDDMRTRTFRQVHLATLRSSQFYDETPLWDNRVYPYRVHFDLEMTRETVFAGSLPEAIVEGIWRSTLGRGRGVETWTTESLFGIAGDPDRARPTDDQFRRVAALAGDLDRLSPGKQRVEQQYLRSVLFGGSSEAVCALCGRTLPVALLVAAHVKPRRDCTDDERRDAANVVMPACALGCDGLYERGYLTIGERGEIRTRTNGATPDLVAKLRQYDGTICGAFTAERAKYFEWHRKHHGV